MVVDPNHPCQTPNGPPTVSVVATFLPPAQTAVSVAEDLLYRSGGIPSASLTPRPSEIGRRVGTRAAQRRTVGGGQPAPAQIASESSPLTTAATLTPSEASARTCS